MQDTLRRPSYRLERPSHLEGGFPIGLVADATQVAERTIHFWTGPAKVITPEVAHGGRGSQKLFSLRNFVQVRVTYLLTQRWIPLATVRALMQAAERARVKKSIDWFQLLGEPAAWRMELLTCTGARDWKWWTVTSPPSPTELAAHVQNQSLAHSRRNTILDADRLRRKVQNAASSTTVEGIFHELQNREDAIVVNLARVKHGILGRLKT